MAPHLTVNCPNVRATRTKALPPWPTTPTLAPSLVEYIRAERSGLRSWRGAVINRAWPLTVPNCSFTTEPARGATFCAAVLSSTSTDRSWGPVQRRSGDRGVRWGTTAKPLLVTCERWWPLICAPGRRGPGRCPWCRPVRRQKSPRPGGRQYRRSCQTRSYGSVALAVTGGQHPRVRLVFRVCAGGVTAAQARLAPRL